MSETQWPHMLHSHRTRKKKTVQFHKPECPVLPIMAILQIPDVPDPKLDVSVSTG
jgi:hypothetical protein